MQALVAGQIDLIFDQLSSSLPQLHAGTIRSYAVVNSLVQWQRQKFHSAGARIATILLAGLAWNVVPKGTPKDIIGKLDGAVVESLADATVRRQLANIGQEIYPRQQQTPEALGAYHKVEIEKWWPISQGGGNQGGVNASTS